MQYKNIIFDLGNVLVETSTALGRTSERAGTSRTSSKVRPSGIAEFTNCISNKYILANIRIFSMKFIFRTFSMQDSQDFQYLIPRIFNLFRFFNLSINMRTFVELSDTLQNAATGAT